MIYNTDDEMLCRLNGLDVIFIDNGYSLIWFIGFMKKNDFLFKLYVFTNLIHKLIYLLFYMLYK